MDRKPQTPQEWAAYLAVRREEIANLTPEQKREMSRKSLARVREMDEKHGTGR